MEKRKRLVTYLETLTCNTCGKQQTHRYKNKQQGREAIRRNCGWDIENMLCGNCNPEMKTILDEAKNVMKDQMVKFDFKYKDFDFTVHCDVIPERIKFK